MNELRKEFIKRIKSLKLSEETEIIEQSGDDDYDAAVLFYYEKKILRQEFDKRTRALKLDEQAKEELFKRFKDCWNTGFECLYCGRKMSLHFENEYSFTIDHYLARSKGGKDTPDNLVFCCRSCNFLKGNRSAENYLKNMERLIARKQKQEYWKARKATEKDEPIRDSYQDIFQIVNAKKEREDQ